MICAITKCNILNYHLVSLIFIPRHTIVAGYYSFTLDVRVSVRPSVVRPSVCFSFPDDNLSKHQWIFTKFGMCIDIVEIWFGIANGQTSSIFHGVICPRQMAGYYSLTFLFTLPGTYQKQNILLLMNHVLFWLSFPFFFFFFFFFVMINKNQSMNEIEL